MGKKPEQLMWDALRKSVGLLWHATRHEDTLSEGIPDVSWGSRGVQGWIELKSLPSWPKKPKTVVSIPHPDRWMKQQTWIRQRGPGCWVLLRVNKDWLIFDWRQAQSVGYMNKEKLFEMATEAWSRTPNGEEFISTITRQGST